MNTADDLADICYPHWEMALEGNFYAIGCDYLYKAVEVIKGKAKPDLLPKKSSVKYEDDHMALVIFSGRNDKYLGFALRNKANFHTIMQTSWMLLSDNGTTPHTGLEDLVDIAQLKLKRAVSGGDIGYSYWLSTRRKDTIL